MEDIKPDIKQIVEQLNKNPLSCIYCGKSIPRKEVPKDYWTKPYTQVLFHWTCYEKENEKRK